MSSRSAYSIALLAVLLMATGAAPVRSVTTGVQSQANPAATPDVTKLGPQVGEKAPDFTLPDQRGQRRTLGSLMGPKGLVLVFNRSADW